MGELELLRFAKEHLGFIGTGAVLVLLIALRFLPAWIAGLRERRLEDLRQRLAEKQEMTAREHDLFSRIDRKDAVLEKLTGNHIQHLEAQLAATREFYTEAMRNLQALNTTQEAIHEELKALRHDAEEIKSGTDFLRGRLS
jgi:uncharacterized membrane protein YhiD involved in acid resistance